MSAAILPLAGMKRQRGSTIVEQAITLPVMVLLMFGVIDMSRALYAYHYVSYIAREASRWASVRTTGVNGPKVGQDEVGNFVADVSGMGLDKNQFKTTVQWLAPPNKTPLCPGGLADDPLNEKPGCIVQVSVDYNFKFVVPFMPAGFKMSSESQMIITQ